MEPSNYRRLTVWQKSYDLALAVYRASEALPKSEIYGLTSQMRRAAVSVPTNIAEGAGRRGKPEFAQFLRVARGSLAELETLLELADGLGYLQPAESTPLKEQLHEVARLLQGLQKSMRTAPK